MITRIAGRIGLGVAGILLMTGLVAPPAGLAAGKITIQMATETAKPDPVANLVEKFKDLVLAKAGSRVEVKFHPAGSLGTQSQLQEQVQLGAIQFIGTASDIVVLDPRFGVFDFPFLFRDRDHVYNVLDGPIGKDLSQWLVGSRGVRILAYGELGFRQITNKVRSIVKPEDLRGLKIRVPPNKLRVAAFTAFGAAATPVPYKELYTALQQGVVDGQENPVITIEALSLWEVQKYISITNHVYTPAYLLVNEKFWQGLPGDLRAQLEEYAREAQAWQRQESQNAEAGVLQRAKAKGMTVNQADVQAFQAAARGVWQEFAPTVGKDLVDRIAAAR